MTDVLKSRMDSFYPSPANSQFSNTPEFQQEQQAREAAKASVLKDHEEAESAKQIAKLKKEALAKARIAKIRNSSITAQAHAEEAERKTKLLEAIEVQAAEDEAPQRAIVSKAIASAEKSGSTSAISAAKELLTMQGTTRADVQKLLLSLNINMNLQLTKTDTANLLACLLTCNEQQLHALSRNPKVPIAIKIVIKRLQEDAAMGNMAALERIWDRVFGKAAMSLELPEQSMAAGIIPNTPISREAYVVIRETLLK